MSHEILRVWAITSKRRKYSVLKRDKTDVIFLQETYLADNGHIRLKKDWIGQVYYSSYKPHSRGTCILLNKNLLFILEKTITDPNGRFVLIIGTIHGTPVTLLNVYAPNIDEPSFISDMVLLFSENCKGLGIIGGDFDLTMTHREESNQVKMSSPKLQRLRKVFVLIVV